MSRLSVAGTDEEGDTVKVSVSPSDVYIFYVEKT
jgi:hypothetical protein